MNKTTLKHLRKASPMKLLFGGLLFILGLYGAIFNNFFNLILSGIGVFLLLREGSEIDLASKKYREIYSVFGISFGKWKTLPNLDYVSVFKTNEKKRVQGMGASANFSNSIYILNLFYNRNKKIEAYRTEDSDDAFENAKYLSQVLRIDVLYATERETKWL
ncbi:hypothetical protein [Aestuariibaculum sediminum]|uniref:Uncharacterized protein n=1 Tax=Aestuariibaculum sediminum TaxID=2770637 RepID=A0A8J6Q6T4_9FLAO|nr:hypothetical protein [Aestuariibaculum sediminum]MBD0831080.1 hypothetical protein [Aestuariibaculum sediminum]